MSGFRVSPGRKLTGVTSVPGDKSISHRALILGGLANGITEIRGFLESDDCQSTLAAMQALGVRIERPAPAAVRIHGVGLRGLRGAPHPLDVGNAGTAMRLLTGLLAAQPFDSELVGDSSLMRRPMERVAVPLREMGARVETHAGTPPVVIRGSSRLRAVRYSMPVASAQVKSAILLAGLYADGETEIIEPATTRDHTERMLAAFGCDLKGRDGVVRLTPPAGLRAASIDVPGDFSSAAFFIVAGCLGADDTFTIGGVGINPTRTGLLDVLGLMGADIRLLRHRSAGAEPVADIEVRARSLHGVHVPERLVPLAIDELPVLLVAAASARGETVVTGARELRVKESDRIAVVAEGLAALGVECEVLPDGLRVVGRGTGGPAFTGGRINSHGDHRIAMSFAIAGLSASETIEIADVANVSTSFPGFASTARAAGLGIEARD